MSFEAAEHRALELGVWMFRPAEQLETGAWTWWCTALDRDGRCSIYEDRPDLCRTYQPGQDGLCVHYWREDRGIASLIEEAEALKNAD